MLRRGFRPSSRRRSRRSFTRTRTTAVRPSTTRAAKDFALPTRRAVRQRRRRRHTLLVGAGTALAMALAIFLTAAVLGAGTRAADVPEAGNVPSSPAPAQTLDGSPTQSAAPLPSQPVSSSPSTPTGPSTPGDEWAAARAKLDRLAVINGTTGHDYDRQMFGQTWADVDRNGCDTRNDILRRDLDHVRIKAGTHGCRKVLSPGILSDPYSGAVVQFTSGPETSWDVQIDHVVPLAWAWRHGADDWTTQRRTEFPKRSAENLLATTAEVNMSKSDSGPSEWLPNSAAEKCDYASTYIDVLTAWDLAINGDDHETAPDPDQVHCIGFLDPLRDLGRRAKRQVA